MKKNKRSFAIATLLFVFIFFLSRCINNQPATDPRGTAFAHAQTCRRCHQAIYDSALLTAHFKASAAAGKTNIPGSFNAGHNSFVYDSGTWLLMEKRDSGYYQVLYKNGRETTARRFDIGFGAVHAQTWLYWQDDLTYELPVSYYYAVHDWATSPGFSAAIPNFDRLIGTDCFECHSSYIRQKKNNGPVAGDYFSPAEVTERFEKNSLVYGIDCQRCHGPAAKHVAFHRKDPDIKLSNFIVSSRSLDRQQQLDRCAVCHSGNDKRKLRSRFAFRPGDLLADFFLSSSIPGSNDKPDVHGNQFSLLKQSRCFLDDPGMTCTTCHDSHARTPANMAAYSQKCMGCHIDAEGNFCTVTVTPGVLLQDNCIDCHMPKQASGAISFQLSGSTALSSYLLRTHRIAIYNAEQQKKAARE